MLRSCRTAGRWAAAQQQKSQGRSAGLMSLPAASSNALSPGVRVEQRRSVSMGPAPAPGSAAAVLTEFPALSPAQDLLEKCLEGAASRGIDVAATYKPWLPVDLMQTLILDVHAAAGCSWIAAIMLTVLGIRVITLPVTIAATRGSREKALITPQFQKINARQQALQQEGNQEKSAKVDKEMQDFLQKHGRFFMLKGTWNLLLFQMPLYITAFATMRGFAGHPQLFPGFAMEAPLWLDSLALADPYGILPCMTACIMLTNTELFGSVDTDMAQANPLTQQQEQTNTPVAGINTLGKYQKHIMRAGAIFFIPMTWNFPAGVFVFMSTNMVMATVQNRLLRLSAVERLLELPPTKETADAAAAAAEGSKLSNLVPLGGTVPGMRQDVILGRIDDGTVRQVEATPMLSATRRARTLLELEESGARAAEEESASRARRPDLMDLNVDPQYSVQRPRAAA
eukprot:TRINITY_DN25580_c0_g1_i2.p1 TRINITY_DN25580_c0_g1~~TRINITY_DN25580_c0_g1_i2.p1  ORF type:complete len:455 (-),score=109.45 TRINITY_DN25580_c0_g1_i2:55-1419(-)